MAYYNTYMPNQGGYYGQPMPMQPQMQSMQPIQMQRQEITLQGKVVDSIDVVKAIDIPLNRKC